MCDWVSFLFVHVQMYVLEMPSALHIFWITWLFMNILVSTWDPMHFPFCTHTYMHTHTLPSLKRWLSVAACSPWINMDRMYCGIVESVFPSPCQGILLGWCFLTQMFMLSSLESETFFLLFLTTFRIVNISHEVTLCGVIALGAWREFPLLQQKEKSTFLIKLH